MRFHRSMKICGLAMSLALWELAAAGQTGQFYTLMSPSELFQENCLAPCLCPYLGTRGPLAGGFQLSLHSSTPHERRYQVSGISWTAELVPVRVWIGGGGTYTIRSSGPTVLHRLELDLSITPLAMITHLDSGWRVPDPGATFPRIDIALDSGEGLCRRDWFILSAVPALEGCYANCDESTAEPVLNAADFACFLQRFVAGDPRANCDQSVTPPVLNVADMACFIQQFAAGCP